MAGVQLLKTKNRVAKPFPSKRETFFYFALGGIMGLLVFLFIYGTATLHVQNDAWLFNGSDLEQTYIGWQSFRNGPWSFPLGLIDNLSFPTKVSVFYIDSIPIMGFICKILSPILPSTFQYLGIWTLFCFIMQGGISSLIIRHYTKSKFLCTILPLFFLTPGMLHYRVFGHTALASQWLILFALLLWIYKDYFNTAKRKFLFWVPFLFFTPLIHTYFTPMVFLIMLGFVLEDTIKYKNYLENILLLVAAVAAIFLALFLFGAFYGNVEVATGNYGMFSSNLATFFDSEMPTTKSLLVPSIGHFPNQYEGSAYLGLGLIILLAFSLSILFYKWTHEKGSFKAFFTLRVKCMIFLMIAIFIFAVSNVVTYGPNHDITIPLPGFVLDFLGIFRASGRFTWIIWYLLAIFLIRTVIQNFKLRTAKIILSICLIIQLIDLSPVIRVRKAQFNFGVAPPQSTAYEAMPWQALSEEITEIVFLMPYFTMINPRVEGGNIYIEEMYFFAEFGIVNDIPINQFYLSRQVKNSLLEEHVQEVTTPYKEGILYVVETDKEYPELNLYIVGDLYTFGTVNDLNLEQYDNVKKISSAKK